jgi:site-specific recombinase XerD
MSVRRTLLAAALVLFVLSACATPGTLASVPLSDTQADLVERWQGFADRVLDSYHLAHVRLIVQHRPDTEGVMATSLRARVIIIDPRALDPRMLPGLAHELGHVVSGTGVRRQLSGGCHPRYWTAHQRRGGVPPDKGASCRHSHGPGQARHSGSGVSQRVRRGVRLRPTFPAVPSGARTGMRGSAMTRRLIRLPEMGLVLHGRTLTDLAEPFLGHLAFVRRRSPHTVKAYRSDIEDFLRFAARVPLVFPSEVRPQHIEFYLGCLVEEGRSASTANRRLHALRSLWDWMEREEIVTKNPAAKCYLLPLEKRIRDYLRQHEQDRVLTTLSARTDLLGRRDHALVATALLTGLRCNELANLQLVHVDLEEGVLSVVRGKGNKDREVPLVPSLISILGRYLGETRRDLLGGGTRISPWFFVKAGPWSFTEKAGEPMSSRGIWKLVQASITPIIGRPGHPHMLRHSFGAKFSARGGDIGILQTAMGHASPRTTMLYAHVATDRMRADMTRLLDQQAKPRRRK